MSIEIKISPLLTKYTGNQQTAEVKGNTVGECLDQLVKKFPDLKPKIYDKDDRLVRYLGVYVNGESAYPEELAKKVKAGDKIHLVMVIAGG